MQRDEWVDTLGVVFERVAGSDAPKQSAPAFFVETDGGAQIVLSARGADSQRTQFSVCTPAEELLREVEIDYTHLRDEVMRLWEQYPLDGTDRAGKKKSSRPSQRRCARRRSCCGESTRLVISM